MQWISELFLHLDTNLDWAVQTYGLWAYVVLFAIIFAETGLVVTPFLPGDSLLFAAGAIAARGSLNLAGLFILLSISAILGDTVNYAVGKYLGGKLIRFIKKEHLDRTHAFFEKYGGKTIIIARFVPIVRTLAPFVAGVGTMTYAKFIIYNVVGGIAWVAICVMAGYFFGNLAIVKNHFTLVILAIIAISLLPAVFEFARARRRSVREGSPP